MWDNLRYNSHRIGTSGMCVCVCERERERERERRREREGECKR